MSIPGGSSSGVSPSQRTPINGATGISESVIYHVLKWFTAAKSTVPERNKYEIRPFSFISINY